MVLAVDQLRIIETDRTSRRFRPRPRPGATAQIAALARRAILLPGLAPLIVLLQQPVETILDPAPQALKTGAPPRTPLTAAAAGASTRDAIHKLAPGRHQTIEALIQRIGAPGCRRSPRAPIGPVAERFHHRRVPPELHATEADPGGGGSCPRSQRRPLFRPRLWFGGSRRWLSPEGRLERSGGSGQIRGHRRRGGPGTGCVDQHTAGMPATAMEPLTAETTGEPAHPPLVGRLHPTAGATGQPAGTPLRSRQRVAMAQGDLKLLLRGIDPGHAGPEAGAMHLAHLKHPIHPGVDHLVAERAEGGLPGQGIKERPGEHDLAEILTAGPATAPIETGRARKPAIAPAQIHQGPPLRGEAALEVLAIEPVEQGQQRFEGHAAAESSSRADILASPSVRLWTAPQKGTRDGLGSGP